MPELGTTTVDKIRVGERAREELGDIEALGTSIKNRGQIQPLAVYPIEDPVYDYELIAGERRLRAMIWANIPKVLIRIYPPTLNKLELEQLELAENYHRKDFTFIEKIKLQRRIYETECALQGVKVSTAADAPGHSMTKQADMLGISQGKVSQDLALSRAMEDFPDAGWERCKNQHEATKLKARLEEQVIRNELAKRFEQEAPKNILIEKFSQSYLLGDCVAGMKNFDANVFDFIEIDPPYAIDLQHNKKADNQDLSNTAGIHEYNEVSPEDYEILMRNVFSECYRVGKQNSWLVCWFGPDPWFEKIYTWLTEAGYSSTRLVGVWVKKQAQTNMPSKRLANATEFFFYAWKGDPVLARPGMLNTFNYSPIQAQQKLHPTERPIEMMIDLVTLFAFEGASVLVPFAGSGNTLIAAALSRMSAVGFDLTKSYRDGYLIKLNKVFGGLCG